MEIIKRKLNTAKNKTTEMDDEDISPLAATGNRLENVGVTSGSLPELRDSFIDVLGDTSDAQTLFALDDQARRRLRVIGWRLPLPGERAGALCSHWKVREAEHRSRHLVDLCHRLFHDVELGNCEQFPKHLEKCIKTVAEFGLLGGNCMTFLPSTTTLFRRLADMNRTLTTKQLAETVLALQEIKHVFLLAAKSTDWWIGSVQVSEECTSEHFPNQLIPMIYDCCTRDVGICIACVLEGYDDYDDCDKGGCLSCALAGARRTRNRDTSAARLRRVI